jgi:hypothetical protein
MPLDDNEGAGLGIGGKFEAHQSTTWKIKSAFPKQKYIEPNQIPER